MQRVIEPAKGRLLVKLGASPYGDIPVPPKDYDSVTYGTIIKLHPDDMKEYGHWIGRVGYFKLYMDDLKVTDELGGDKLSLIAIDKIDGTSYEE